MKYIELRYDGTSFRDLKDQALMGENLRSKFEEYGSISIAFSTKIILQPVVQNQGFGDNTSRTGYFCVPQKL